MGKLKSALLSRTEDDMGAVVQPDLKLFHDSSLDTYTDPQDMVNNEIFKENQSWEAWKLPTEIMAKELVERGWKVSM